MTELCYTISTHDELMAGATRPNSFVPLSRECRHELRVHKVLHRLDLVRSICLLYKVVDEHILVVVGNIKVCFPGRGRLGEVELPDPGGIIRVRPHAGHAATTTDDQHHHGRST